MKKIMIAAAATAMLAACGPKGQATPQPTAPDVPVRKASGTIASSPSRQVQGIETFTDPKTGCEYLVLYDKGITPRYEAGGSASSGAGLTRVRGCQ